MGEPEPSPAPTPGQRRFVLATLALLLVTGLVGIEAWPVSAWRLFSEPRRAELGGFALLAVRGDEPPVPVSLSRLPMGYRFAGRALEDLPPQPSPEGGALCAALLDAVRDERPGTTGLEVLRTRRRLVAGDGRRGSIEVSSRPFLACGTERAP